MLPGRGPAFQGAFLGAFQRAFLGAFLRAFLIRGALLAPRTPSIRYSFRMLTSSWTAAADFLRAADSVSVSLISQIFSMPFWPSWAGTPT